MHSFGPRAQSSLPFNAITLWLAHEIENTMHRYVEANFAVKEKALDRLEAPGTKAQSAAIPRIGLADAVLQTPKLCIDIVGAARLVLAPFVEPQLFLVEIYA